jgi:hypothetical protein
MKMNRCIAIFLILVSLSLPAGTAMATVADTGEGYAVATYPELIQTLIMMGGADITNTKIADEYGRLVYCGFYKKAFSNDVLWEKIRNEIVNRALKKKEYFRVKYEVVSIFYLGRYDMQNEYFPISHKSSITNVGSVSLFSNKDFGTDCSGQNINSTVFPMDVVMKLNEPLTIPGFRIPRDRVEKLNVRMEEAGDSDRRVYGRIRLITTDAKGLDFTDSNTSEEVLDGKVISVDFFIDRELTKPIAHIRVNKE